MSGVYRLSTTLYGHSADVRSLSTSDTAPALFSASRDGTARSWAHAAGAAWDEGPVFKDGHEGFVNAVQWVKAGGNAELIATAGQDALIQLWPLPSPLTASSTPLPPLYTLAGHTSNVCTLHASADGKRLVSGSWDKTARVWSLEDFSCVYTLEGHEQSVWAVLALGVDGAEVLTGAADNDVKLWRDGKAVKTFKGHTQPVRALAKLSPGVGDGSLFASAGNDGSIRLWSLTTGEAVHVLNGHDSFVYSLSAIPDSLGGGLISGGEDRTMRVWRAADGSCEQTIVIPAISVWTVACLPTGDIAAGSSDGIIRVFTKSEDRIADAETLTSFDKEVSQVGDIKKDDLPGPEALDIPGNKEGAVKVVRSAAGVAEAYQWSQGTWVKIGEVVDAVGNSRKQLYNGEEYDYVFDVDIQEGMPPLKLPYNVTQNPYEVAQNFLDRHELPRAYIDEVVKHIENNTGGVTLGTGSSEFVDPYTGASRYTGGGAGSTPARNTSAYSGGPYTGGGRSAASQATPKLLPHKSYLSFTQANLVALRTKLGQLNEQLASDAATSSLALSAEELIVLDKLVAFLLAASTAPGKASTVGEAETAVALRLLQWPSAHQFPGLDLVRIISVYSPVHESIPTLLEVIQNTSGPTKEQETNTMLAFRALANIFASPSGKSLMTDEAVEIVGTLKRRGFVGVSKNGKIAIATVALNYSVLAVQKSLASGGAQLFDLVAELLRDNDPEVVYRSLIALGNLLLSPQLTADIPGAGLQRYKTLAKDAARRVPEARIKAKSTSAPPVSKASDDPASLSFLSYDRFYLLTMPFDPATGLYTPLLPSVHIPDDATIFDFLFGRSEKQPDAIWLRDAITGRTLTRQQAHDRSVDIARALSHSHGLGNDDVLALFSGNEVDYGTVLWGAFRVGAIASAANPSYGPDELRHQLSLVNGHYPVKVLATHPDSVATSIAAVKLAKLPQSIIVLICPPGPTSPKEAANFKTLDDLIAESKGKDLAPIVRLKKGEARKKLAFLSFSSGTTGLPKAVEIPHYSVVANVAQGKAHWDGTKPFKRYDEKTKTGDSVLGVLPFFHIYGLVVVLHLSLYQDVPVVTLNKFALPAFLEAIQRWKITSLYIVPPIVVLLAKEKIVDNYDLSSLRFGMAGAAPLTEEIGKAIKKRIPHMSFGQGYGSTESCTLVTLFNPSAKIPGSSAGLLVPNIEAKVVSPDGKLLPPGEIGELLSRSPSNAIGYLGNAKATKETFDDDGFVHTGDEVYIAEDGWVYVVDRIKELIKCNGFQVAPAELEGHILDHPDVQDTCVIGILDEKKGERPKAFIALSPEAKERLSKDSKEASKIKESVMKFVADNKVHYKHLKEVAIIDAIPKTASGKLLRKDLRIRGSSSGLTAHPLPSALQGSFAEHLAALSAVPDITSAAVKTVEQLALCDGLIIPGGESTTISLLARKGGLLEPLRAFVEDAKAGRGKSCWGTCAGMIFLSKEVIGAKDGYEGLDGVDCRVVRNQFGRQSESFTHYFSLPFISSPHKPFEATFIRAPVLHSLLPSKSAPPLEPLVRLPPSRLPSSPETEVGPDADIVMLRQGGLLISSFHPELGGDRRIHEWWAQDVVASTGSRSVE
ncbi:phospholipase A-2-activating protein [Pseudohyphozyma bogoriensis]|nr:phospholipase A-2-activating protein [Pseudohyphozyma bogoriensis]